MAHHVEPMDIDSDFDNKENSFHHNNVLPLTEKGYEELDVSELNMKLRYSVTPGASPMSKSCTAVCPESGDESLNVTVNENLNLTRSLNTTMTKNDNTAKSAKSLPLQSIPTEKFVVSNRNTSVLRLKDSPTPDNGNITVNVSGPSDIDENLSLPSSSSSTLHTPEATTPTKDISVKDGGSPIMRGLKSVLNMFRSSQSPIPPVDNDNIVKPEILSPVEEPASSPDKSQVVLASTPISSHRKKEMSPTKRSPPKDNSIVFNEDLEKELQWKDETTIIFSQERIPIHKLLLQQPQDKKFTYTEVTDLPIEDINSTLEYMDISYNDSFNDKTITDFQDDNKKCDITATESDNEFVDCETTFTQTISQVIGDKDSTIITDRTQDLDQYIQKNDSGSRLKPIILDTTQDILDATLSVRPEDLLAEESAQIKDMSTIVFDITHTNDTKEREAEEIKEQSTETNEPIFDQTVNITNPTFEAHGQIADATKTIEILFAPQPTSSSSTTMELPIENVDNTATINDALDVTVMLEKSNVLNRTISSATVVLDNKTFDIEVIPHVENDIQGTEPLEIKSKVCYPINSVFAADTSIPKAIDLPVEEANKLLPHDIITEASQTELPVDVPLPDEDDIDKELEMVDSIPDVAPPVSLPVDFVDDIKIMTEIEEKINSLNEIEVNMAEKLNTIELITPKSVSLEIPLVEDGNSIINETDSTGAVPVEENSEQYETKILDKTMETIDFNTLPEVVALTNDDNIETNFEAYKTIENVEKHNKLNVTENREVVSMDINDSVCEFKPLPDIINQTITMSNMECGSINSDASVSAEIKQEEPSITVLPEVANSTMNGIEQNITSTNESVGIYIKTVTESEVAVAAADTVTQEASVLSTPTTDINTKLIENVTNKVEIKTDIAPALDVELKNVIEKPEVNQVEEEVVFENNSPFVSVIADTISELKLEENPNIENLDKPLPIEINEVITQPSSPPITSKGYNFNFDDLDFDPFATKTKIRLSPPIDSPNKPPTSNTLAKIVDKPLVKKDFNRRRSQPERKKPVAPKRKLNSTFDGKINDKGIEKLTVKTKSNLIGDIQIASPDTVALEQNNVTIEENKLNGPINTTSQEIMAPKEIVNTETEIVHEDNVQQTTEILSKESDTSFKSAESVFKSASSTEQSAHYSTCTSGSETYLPSKNVFNLPEIDDMNFNPFATKSKMRQSPPPNLNLDDLFVTNSKIKSSPDSSIITTEKSTEKGETKSFEEKVGTELMEKDSPVNISNVTDSHKAADEVNSTGSTANVHTDNEDTVEGPFLEADDFNHDDKMSDFDGENDLMQFNELPAQNIEDNLDNGEMFIDAEAFEFLLNQNKCNTVVDSGKESLFLKFDPLFAKRMSAMTSDGVVASLAQLQKKQSTPTKAAPSSPKNMPSPIAGPSNINVTQDMDMSEEFNDDLNITVSKPMMVVPPAVNPTTPRNKSLTPNRSNRRSFTFTSPAMAFIDRLLSLSDNNSLVQDTTVTQVSREQNEADIALSQLRELLAEKEINVYQLRSESNDLRDRLSTLEGHVKNLEAESGDRLKKINQLTDTLAEKTKINKSMAVVVEEYERTIASLIAETAQDKKRHAEERMQLINERDEQTAHLASMEVSFSDLHSKYEKSKQIILICKANEETYKKSIKDFEENLNKMQNNYELLKQHATSKLNHANQELEKINRIHEAELLKLNAMIKRKELHITSLEESLTQKTKANEELTAICDELINKVG